MPNKLKISCFGFGPKEIKAKSIVGKLNKLFTCADETTTTKRSINKFNTSKF